MIKRLLTGLALVALSMALVISPISAKDSLTDQEKIQSLVQRKIIEGNENGDLGLDQPISRAEFAKIIVVSLDLKDQADKLKTSPSTYKDFGTNHWAHGYVKALSTLNSNRRVPLLAGYQDGTFQPGRKTSRVEASKILALLGTPETTKTTLDQISWPDGWMALSQKLGLSLGLRDPNLAANRQEVFVNLYDVCFGEKIKTKDLKTLMQGPGKIQPEPGSGIQDLLNKINQDMAYQGAYRQEILTLVNQARAQAGLRPLGLYEDLARGARERAGELAIYGSTRVNGQKHVRLDGTNYRSAFAYLPLSNPRYHLGENLLMTKTPHSYLKNPRAMIHNPRAQARNDFNAWMASPGHRDNILREDYSHLWTELALGPNYRDAPTKGAGIQVSVMTLYKE